MGGDGRPTPETQTPFQPEGEANTSPGRRRWVEANHDAATRALDRLHDLKDRHALVGDVRGHGLLLGIDLVRSHDTKEPANDAAEAVLYRALDRGLTFKVTMANVLTLSPPLVIARDDLDRALDIVDACLGEV